MKEAEDRDKNYLLRMKTDTLWLKDTSYGNVRYKHELKIDVLAFCLLKSDGPIFNSAVCSTEGEHSTQN